jgi:neurotransmitter:Na+ symporter, NSS family
MFNVYTGCGKSNDPIGLYRAFLLDSLSFFPYFSQDFFFPATYMRSNPMSPEPRGVWGSKIGFILAAAGSAVGLGNIWRFPYVTGENGGAVFVIIYIFCVFIIGVPVIFAELAIGRHTQKNPVGAIEHIAPKSAWKVLGYLGVLTGLCILSYYALVAGWTFGYIFKTIFHDLTTFGDFIDNETVSISLYIIFLLMTIGIVYGGVSGGIERWAKILMPLLPVLLIAITVYALTLENAMDGIRFYLRPDFSEVGGKTILVALGQAFFSLSLGMGAMMTYGSYLSKKENVVSSGVTVVIFDILIALLAGFAIFPAIFAFGKSPAEGAALVFVILPEIFEAMPGGILVGGIFFVLLSIAALTSAISLLEVPVAFLIDEKKMNRKIAVWLVGGITLLVGLPSALSFGNVGFLSSLPFWEGRSFFDLMDFIFGTVALPLGGLFLAIFVGWRWGALNASNELNTGNGSFIGFQSNVWVFLIKFICPIIILLVLLNTIGVF